MAFLGIGKGNRKTVFGKILGDATKLITAPVKKIATGKDTTYYTKVGSAVGKVSNIATGFAMSLADGVTGGIASSGASALQSLTAKSPVESSQSAGIIENMPGGEIVGVGGPLSMPSLATPTGFFPYPSTSYPATSFPGLNTLPAPAPQAVEEKDNTLIIAGFGGLVVVIILVALFLKK